MEAIRRVIYHFSAATFCFILIILAAAVFARYALNDSIIWAEELMSFAFIWMFFLSMGEVSRNGAHLALDLIPSLLKGWPRRVIDIFVELVNIAFLIVLLYYSYRVSVYNLGQRSPAMLIPYGYIYFAIPVGCVLMILFSCQRTYWHITGTAPNMPKKEGIE